MKQRGTVLWRISLIFFALVIPWSVLSFCLLQSANQNIQHSAERTLLQSRENALENFEDRLANIYTTALLCNAMERATYLSTLNEYLTAYEYAQAVDQIFESLTLLNTMGEFLDGTRIYIRSLKTIYNNEGSLNGSVQPLADGEFARLEAMASHTVSLTVDGDRLLMLLKNARVEPTCILEAELSRYDLYHYLKSNLQYTDSLFFLQFQDSDISVSNTSQGQLLDEAMAAAEENAVAGFSCQYEDYYVYSFRSDVFNCTYYEYFPQSHLVQPVQLSGMLTLIYALLSVVVTILFFVESVKLIHRPLQNLTGSFAALRKGDFSVRAQSPETPDFAYLYDSFNHMAQELDMLVSQNYQQKILLQKAELRQLQAQINPHFLYNSFFLLQRVISSGDTEQAEQIARELGIYFRYITKQNTDTVLLKNEAEHAKIYADIQAIRFSQRIRVEFEDLPEQFAHMWVPKLFLQPLIENAFKYALENKLSGGILRVSYQTDHPGRLTIAVEDNGDTLSQELIASLMEQIRRLDTQNANKELSGILNIARRLQLHYQTPDSVTICRSDLGGMKVLVRLDVDDAASGE